MNRERGEFGQGGDMREKTEFQFGNNVLKEIVKIIGQPKAEWAFGDERHPELLAFGPLVEMKGYHALIINEQDPEVAAKKLGEAELIAFSVETGKYAELQHIHPEQFKNAGVVSQEIPSAGVVVGHPKPQYHS